MQAPPDQGTPYDAFFQNIPNYGTIGVLGAWDAMRQFWGGVAQQGWTDIAYAIQGGVLA